MSNTPSLADAESACAAYGHDPARCGFELCRDVVLAVRESKLSRPDLVVKYGQYLLKSHASRLGPEVWALYEQARAAKLWRAWRLRPLHTAKAVAGRAQPTARSLPSAAGRGWPWRWAGAVLAGRLS